MKIDVTNVNPSTVPGLEEIQQRHNELVRRHRELASLELGDIIEVQRGRETVEVEFTRLRQKKFEALFEGKPWIFDNELYIRLVRKAVKNESYKTLQRGEAFYINDKGKAELFIFKEMKNGKLLGINPVGMVPTTIPVQMYVGKVADIKISI